MKNNKFDADPFGFSSIGWHKFELAKLKAGLPAADIRRFPTFNELREPVLWLSHSKALIESARAVLNGNPNFHDDELDICISQYHAVALMLIGLSLELCLKAILILKEDEDKYLANENSKSHHRLNDLAELLPNLILNNKEQAILELLTEFVYWAGRYPAPLQKKKDALETIFKKSESHKVSAKDLFACVEKINDCIIKILYEDTENN